MYTNLRHGLREAFKRAEILGKRSRPYVTRHTYISARLQTLDKGEPVSVFTVCKEVGHRDPGLIMRVYGHLQRDRKRLPIVEFREATVTELEQMAR